MSDFEARNHKAWKTALKTAFGTTPPRSATWSDVDGMINILKPFMARNLNHAMLPGGGGLDFHAIERAREPGCVRCDTGEQSFYLGRPRKLAFEYIDRSPANSFFLMDLNTLKPSGIYENVQSESEQLMEVDEEYHDYGIWDRGFMGYDHEDREIPIPEEASVVVRLLRGKILIVAKASLWNHETGTYDGRHEHMMAEDIRGIIERSI